MEYLNMRARKGLTLIETSITVLLVSMLLFGLFELAQVQRNVIRRLQHNTTALYLIESIKNQIRYEFSKGATASDITSECFSGLIESYSWIIDLAPEPDNRLVKVSLHNTTGGRYATMYKFEVRMP